MAALYLILPCERCSGCDGNRLRLGTLDSGEEVNLATTGVQSIPTPKRERNDRPEILKNEIGPATLLLPGVRIVPSASANKPRTLCS